MRTIVLLLSWLLSLLFILFASLAGFAAIFIWWFGVAAIGLLFLALLLNPLARAKLTPVNTPARRRVVLIAAILLCISAGAGALFRPERPIVYALKDFGLNTEGLYQAGLNDADSSKGHTPNFEQARRRYEAAARQGHQGAEYELALMHATGRGATRDDAAAVAKLESLAARHYPKAMATLGAWRFEGTHGLQKDEQAGYELMKSAGKAGSDQATVMIAVKDVGLEYKAQTGAEITDEETRTSWLIYKLAADGGDASAAERYGDLLIQLFTYLDGAKISSADKKIIFDSHEKELGTPLYGYMKYLQFAADHGQPRAQRLLFEEYYFGSSITKQDKTKGLLYLEMAAKGGDADAEYKLASLYYSGRAGAVVDEARALALMQNAAKKGNDIAQNELAIMYAYGEGGLKKDKAEARRLFKASADSGNDTAKKNLALLDD